MVTDRKIRVYFPFARKDIYVVATPGKEAGAFEHDALNTSASVTTWKRERYFQAGIPLVPVNVSPSFCEVHSARCNMLWMGKIQCCLLGPGTITDPAGRRSIMLDSLTTPQNLKINRRGHSGSSKCHHQ